MFNTFAIEEVILFFSKEKTESFHSTSNLVFVYLIYEIVYLVFAKKLANEFAFK